MSTAGSPSPRFRIGYLDGALDGLYSNQTLATRDGYGPAHRESVERVLSALAHAANGFGEAIYDLPDARLQVRRAIVRPVIVVFAVHYRRPEVFVRHFDLLPPPA